MYYLNLFKSLRYVFYFPFDSQNCSIVIGSFKHSSDRINFETGVGKIDLASYQSHPIWALSTIVVNSVYSTDRLMPNINQTSEAVLLIKFTKLIHINQN